jgi:hypothetical protein
MTRIWRAFCEVSGWIGVATLKVLLFHTAPLSIAVDTLLFRAIQVLVHPTPTAESDNRLLKEWLDKAVPSPCQAAETWGATYRTCRRIQEVAESSPDHKHLARAAQAIIDNVDLEWFTSEDPAQIAAAHGLVSLALDTFREAQVSGVEVPGVEEPEVEELRVSAWVPGCMSQRIDGEEEEELCLFPNDRLESREIPLVESPDDFPGSPRGENPPGYVKWTIRITAVD